MRISLLLRQLFWKITGKKLQSSERPDYDYYAFISYKHKKEDGQFEADSRWAKRLKIELEMMHISSPPVDSASIINEYDNTLSQVFRDDDVLSGGELTPAIQKALQSSKLLVIIISKQMVKDQDHWEEVSLKEKNILEAACKAGKITEDEFQERLKKVPKAWLKEEFDLFTNGGTENLENVCLVNIEGCPFSMDNPELVPRYLLGKVDNKRVISPYENFKEDPISSILPWKKLESRWGKDESHFVERTSAAIAAQIFGQNGDQFWSYRKKQKQARNLQWLLATIGVLIVVGSLVLSERITSSQNYLSEARRALAEGNRKEAMELALRSYDKWSRTDDLTQFMWSTLEPKEPFISFDSKVAVSQKKHEFAAIRDEQFVDIYDGESLHVIQSYGIGHGGTLIYSPNGEKLAVFSSEELSIIDRASGQITHSFSRFYVNDIVQFSHNGDYIDVSGRSLKTADLDSPSVVFPKLPYDSYKVNKSSASFLGTSNRIAYIKQIYDISGKSPADTIWTVSIYDLSKDSSSLLRPADIYYEFPDSVSYVHAYGNRPVIFSASHRRVSFFRVEGNMLTDAGWTPYPLPISEGYGDDWITMQYCIRDITNRPNGDGFILHTDKGVSFALDSLTRLKTAVSAIENRNRLVSTFKGDLLAVDDSLILVADDYGHLFLRTSVDPNPDGSLKATLEEPLSGLSHYKGSLYSLNRLGDYQFVSQSQIIPMNGERQTKTIMYWDKDTREIPTLSIANHYWCLYSSPDLRFALVCSNAEFGIYIIQTEEFIPVCPRFPHSSGQDIPLYVSDNGDNVYVLSATETNGQVLFDLIRVNLRNKKKSVILEDMERFSALSKGVILAQSKECTCIVDLRHSVHIVRYDGWLDIKNENGLYSVMERRGMTSKTSYIAPIPLIYDNSSATFIATEDSTDFYSSPCGNYRIVEKIVGGIITFVISDLSSSRVIAELTGDVGERLVKGFTEDEQYFIYSERGNLSIFELKSRRIIRTQHRINSANKSMLLLANRTLLLPANTFRIIDLASGESLISIPAFHNNQRSFSPDEKWLLAGEYLVNIENREITSSSIPDGYNRHLTNEYIIYSDKCLPLPHQKELIQQLTTILRK